MASRVEDNPVGPNSKLTKIRRCSESKEHGKFTMRTGLEQLCRHLETQTPCTSSNRYDFISHIELLQRLEIVCNGSAKVCLGPAMFPQQSCS